MDEITLVEGASFGEITTATADPNASTEATSVTPQVEVKPDATDGVTPEPEVPAAFKEQPSEEENKPDLSLSDDLKDHPVLRAKWEAYKADKEKGIDKFINDHNAKLKEAEAFQEQYAPLVDFYDEFGDESTVDAAFQKLCAGLEKTYGRKFGVATTQNTPAAAQQEDVDPDSKYGLEYASDDKVVDAVVKILDQRLGEFTGKLEPIQKHFTTQAEREAQAGKAQAALPELKQAFEIAADPWVTAEKITEAMSAYPGMDAVAAFRAHFAIDIGKYYAKHSTARTQKVGTLPTGTSGAQTRPDLRPGASFADILQAEATLG